MIKRKLFSDREVLCHCVLHSFRALCIRDLEKNFMCVVKENPDWMEIQQCGKRLTEKKSLAENSNAITMNTHVSIKSNQIFNYSVSMFGCFMGFCGKICLTIDWFSSFFVVWGWKKVKSFSVCYKLFQFKDEN